jgi:hypothetical protein
MIEPYNAVGLIPTVWGISKREEIFRNIEHPIQRTCTRTVRR